MKRLFLTLLCLVSLLGCQTTAPPLPNDLLAQSPTVSSDPACDNEQPLDPLPEEKGTFTLTLCGDVFIGKEFADAEERYGKGYGFKQVAPYFQASDLTFVNLETSVTERGTTKKRAGFAFRTPASTLSVLTDAGIDAVSIANNHVFDYDEIGLTDTFEALENANIPYTGAGTDQDDAAKAVYFSVKGHKIGFLAFDQCIPWKAWSATEDKLGVATFTRNDADFLLSRVEEVSATCDWLIVSLHWGTEYTHVASDWERTLAHKLVDAGADVIYGHHPHVLQGIEMYRDRPILYSCGNFLFYKKNDDAGETAFFTLTFDADGLVKGEFTPVYINHMQSTLLSPSAPRYKNILSILSTQSKKYGTDINTEECLFYER